MTSPKHTPVPLETMAEIDRLITSGQTTEARVLLDSIFRNKLPREQIAPIAWFLMRCSLHDRALHFLHPYVRGSSKAAANPSAEEKALYAGCLGQMGASKEALTILSQVSPVEVPQSLLFKGFTLVSDWDYEAAIPVFLHYLESSGLSTYQLTVGQMNLAACYVHEKRFSRANELLEVVSNSIERNGWKRLEGNIAVLKAENLIGQKAWNEAATCIASAKERLKDNAAWDSLFMRKFKVFLELEKSGVSSAALSELLTVKREAIEAEHWDTVRDCDRVLAKVTRDESLFQRVYFGTPFQAYRRWIEKDFGGQPALPKDYVLSLGEPKAGSPLLDLRTGKWSKKAPGLRIGSLDQKLLAALAADFYRPARILALHERIEPDLYFTPLGSVQKMYEAIRHLRAYLEKSKMPLEIEEIGGRYRLNSPSSCHMKIYDGEGVADSNRFQFDRIKEKFPTGIFLAKDVMALCDLPRRTANRLLVELTKQNRIQCFGSKSGTRYEVVQNEEKKAA